MNKYLFLFVQLFMLLFVTNAKADENQNNDSKQDHLQQQIAKYNDLQSEKDTLKKQINDIEKEKSSDDPERVNKRIRLYMDYNKVLSELSAYRKAIIAQEPSYFDTKQENVDFSKIIKGIVPNADYKKYYIAAGEKYGVDWAILAAIHKIETNYSTHSTMISTAGAIGHMQFMPETFKAYGVDGDNDGIISPWDVADSIYSAANYLAANGFKNNIRGAIWCYNHADWYVNNVIQTAAIIRNG